MRALVLPRGPAAKPAPANDIAGTHALKEFCQADYTCENSFGWSRIDRAYTNLHAADVSTMRTMCNVLEYPRHLSGHRPISISIAQPRKKHKGRKQVPQWVTAHPSFRDELEEDYRIRQDDFLRTEKRTPSPFDNLRIFKESSYAASGFIRRACAEAIAVTTEHKLAIHTSFMRCIHMGNFAAAIELQKKCDEIECGSIDTNTQFYEEFRRVKDRTVELMQTSVRERAVELKQVRGALPENIYETRKKSIMETLRKMTPGGTSEIAALKTSIGNIVTETWEIAAELNCHWQKVFEKKDTDCELRRRWLEELRDKLKAPKEKLRPTKEIVEKAIRDAAPSSSGPDGIPFEVYKVMGQTAVDLFLEISNSMFDQTDAPADDFNLAYMVCISKEDEGISADGMPYCSAGGTRPISIVDAANRVLASIFTAILERNVGSFSEQCTERISERSTHAAECPRCRHGSA